MKAIFVLYPDDPPEYFEQIHALQDRVFLSGGCCSVECKVFSGWNKPPREYLEYRFECNSMGQLV